MSVGVALGGGRFEPLDCLVGVLQNALAHQIHPPKIELGFRIPLLGQRSKFLERGRVVLLLISAVGGREICPCG